eukprot:gb/GECH01008402.1/.p1 GENE.gb/GECH01008402.1/~~gb/GECH01008402.1/.p1  ORF type:complete len:582 (+),score=145.30 gb/GECH01008402.1/:1-1746(+)
MSLSKLKDDFDNACTLFSQGLDLEEQTPSNVPCTQAANYYKQGIQVIEDALTMEMKPHEWQEAEPLLAQLKRHKKQFMDRIQVIYDKQREISEQQSNTHTNNNNENNNKKSGGMFSSFTRLIHPNKNNTPAQSSNSSSSGNSNDNVGVMTQIVTFFIIIFHPFLRIFYWIFSFTTPNSQHRNSTEQHHFIDSISLSQVRPSRTETNSYSATSDIVSRAQPQNHSASAFTHRKPSSRPVSSSSSSSSLFPSSSINRTPKTTSSTAGKSAKQQRKPSRSRGGLPPELKGVDKKILNAVLDDIVEDSTGVSWDDIAGLDDAKRVLNEVVVLPQLRPDLFTGLRGPARGVLLFGPPGNGKTLIAKAVAASAKCTFFNLSASSLVSKWHGESERMVKALFAAARYLQPAVVFIDEVDSILTSRSSNEHEASRRLKTEFLVQMDGVHGSSEDKVVVLGATNRPQELDEAALRRFTKRILIPLPDPKARVGMIRHLLSRHPYRLSRREFDSLASMTQGYSGSDLSSLCKEAALGPLRELGSQVVNVSANSVREIEFRDFKTALSRVKPSTSPQLLSELENWNKQFGAS